MVVVDDSAVMRQLLTQILARDPDIEVVAQASDPYIARDKIKQLNPDVITLDVEMPRMDGLAFLEKLMRGHPMPVVMVSSLTERGCETTLRALELGAVDFVTKPKLDVTRGTLELAGEIVAKVKAAARAHVRPLPASTAAAGGATRPVVAGLAGLALTHKVIAIGASTGGTEALREVLTRLPADTPGVVVVQHMPASFTRAFANRLDSLCSMVVKEASDGDRVLPGHVLVAPGDYQLSVVRSGANYAVRVVQDPPVNRHRPSVDVLFDSCARELGGNAVGVILTGMGDDGARGLKAMRQAGAHTIAQDEASCVVFGMPREAIAQGGAEQVLPLNQVSEAVLKLVTKGGDRG